MQQLCLSQADCLLFEQVKVQVPPHVHGGQSFLFTTHGKHFSATVPDGYRGGDWMTVELASYTLMPPEPAVGRGYPHAAPARVQVSPAPFQMQDREQQLTETHVTSLHALPTPGAAAAKASARASAAVDALVRLASAAQAASDAKRDERDDARDESRVWNTLQAVSRLTTLPPLSTVHARFPGTLAPRRNFGTAWPC